MKDNFISTIPKEFIPYQLPENWKWFLWSDLITNYQQGMIRSNSQLGEGNAEYLKMGDLDSSGRANFSNLARTEASQKEIEEFLLKEGDFLINVRNSKELVGKTCLIQNINNRTVLFNHMLVRMDHGSIELNYYINAFLNIPSSKKMLDRIKQGTTTVIALYQRDLNKIPIPLPDNKTFNNIVELYKSINQKIELNNKINAELEAMAKTLYDYWFVQFDFPNENGKPYKSSGGKMVWNEDLKRVIPEGWDVKELGELIRPLESGKRPKGGIDKDLKNGIPSLGAESIDKLGYFNYKSTKYIPFSYKERITSGVIQNNDILIYKDGAYVGKTTLFRDNFPFEFTTINEHVFLLRSSKNYLQEYLFFTLKLESYYNLMQSLGQKAAQPGLNQNDLKSLNIIEPNDEIVMNYQQIIEPFFARIFNNSKENQELASLRDWLLPMLMNGQVTVGGVDEEVRMVAEEKVEYKRN